MRSRTAWLASFGVALLGAAAFADDILQLKDGRIVDGVPMKVDGAAVVVTYKNGELRVPSELIEDYVIGGATLEPVGDEAKAQRANGQVMFRGKWVKPEQRDKLVKAAIEKRKTEIAEAKAHSEWRNRYQFQSKYFRFESTLTPSQNEHYSSLLDAYFEVFKKDWGISVPKGWGKLKVCVYPDMDSFLKGAGADRGTLAYYKFVPMPERELNFFNERGDERLTETVMFHECNHYLVDLFSEGLRYPHWIGESMAEYYGASTFDERTKTVKSGQIQEGRLAEIRSDIGEGKKFTLADLILEGPHYEDYYWGWSFTHFMMETPAYQKKFKKFFVDLARSADVKRKTWGGSAQYGFTSVDNEECMRVFKKIMGLSDAAAVEKLQAEWWAYVDKLEAPGVRGYEEAGKRAFWDGMFKFRAPRLLKLAIEKGSKDPDTYIALSRCLRMRGKEALSEALSVMTKACDIDPLSGDCWAERGFVLQLMGQGPEGKKLVDLAYELNPGGYYVDYQTLLTAAGEGDK